MRAGEENASFDKLPPSLDELRRTDKEEGRNDGFIGA